MIVSKRDWVLLALSAGPLDRIHLMEALFLTWNRLGRNIPGFFQFTPSLSYGPCNLECHSMLDTLCEEGLAVKAPHEGEGRAKYHLTVEGRIEAEQAAERSDPAPLGSLQAVVKEVGALAIYSLLRKGHSEALEHALNVEPEEPDVVEPKGDPRSAGERWSSLGF